MIYTIGTSTRSLDEFLGLLKKHKISTLIDVRRFPTSRFEHFKRENLEKLEGINYCHLSGLGGYRGGYEKYMRSREFKEAFEELLSLVEKGNAAIMCAERLFFRCHRRFVSDELVKRGIKVIHIIDEKRIYEHRLKSQSQNLFVLSIPFSLASDLIFQ